MRVLTSLVVLAAVAPLVGCPKSSVEQLEGRWSGQILCGEGNSDITIGFDVEGDTILGTAISRTKGVEQDWSVRGQQISCERFVRCADDTCQTDQDCAAKHEYSVVAPPDECAQLKGTDEPCESDEECRSGSCVGTGRLADAGTEIKTCADDSCTAGSCCPERRSAGTSCSTDLECRSGVCDPSGRCAAPAPSSCGAEGRCAPCTRRSTVLTVRVTLSDENVQIADPKLELERSGEERLEGAICFFCKSGLLKPQVTLTKD